MANNILCNSIIIKVDIHTFTVSLCMCVLRVYMINVIVNHASVNNLCQTALKQTGADELISTDIHRILLLEGVRTTPQTIRRFLMRYCKTNSINWAFDSACLSKLTEDVVRLIDLEMKKNDETTATTLHTFFLEHGLEISI